MGVVHRNTGRGTAFNWEGVTTQRYEGGGASGVMKYILLGAADGSKNFAVRYFEVAPGGRTAYDQHQHDHGVFILKGRARVLLGQETVEVCPGDAVHVAPNEVHQFESIGDEPLGFLCIIPPLE